jgi:thioesterase domain-containing protein
VRQQFGIEVALTRLFANPTIKGLAREGAPKDWALLELGAVPFRTQGSEPPLFLVHEVSGEMFYVQKLMRHIDASVRIYGLTSEPLAKVSLRTMQGMAARLARTIRAVQPTGPYRVAGWSFGGMLAYEIATHLIGQDEKVEFLGLFDTVFRAPEVAEVAPLDEAFFRVIVMQRSPAAIAAELNAIEPGDFDALVRKCQELSLIPKRLSTAQIQQYVSRWQIHYSASDQYQAYPIPVPIHLFAAQDSVSGDASRGWNAVLPAELIHIIPVPGGHSTMMNDPHIASLGSALSQAIDQAAPSRSAQVIGGYSPLLPVQAGRPGISPVFCIPGAGGNAASFADFADALGEIWPVYAVQPRGLNGLDVPHSTVAAAAQAYLTAMEEISPKLPVHLVGHSFGGWVAFEMALRLRAAGRKVTSLTLIDSDAPRATGREYTHGEALMKLMEIWELASERPLGIVEEDIAKLNADEQLALLHERLVQVGLMPARSRPEALPGVLRTFGTAVRTTYQPNAVYIGPIRLVLLTDSRLEGAANERQFAKVACGWETWAPNLDVWHGPGNHMTALKLPNVQLLADWMGASWNE